MIGEKHGKWTVVNGPIRKKIGLKNRIFYECKCECGTIKLVRNDQLIRPKSTECIRCLTKAIDVQSYIGNKFGKWLVIEVAAPKGGSQTVLCECECGYRLTIRASMLRSAETTQCVNCCKKQNILRLTKHGRSYDSIYTTWQQAKKRCTNPRDKDYSNYGGRGIRMCDRWLFSFEFFLEDMGDRPTGLQIDRINVNGNYEPNNCRWVTPKENHENRRCSKKNKIPVAQLSIASPD